MQEEGLPVPEGPEYKHGLTPAMRDARRRRFRREPDLNVSPGLSPLETIELFCPLHLFLHELIGEEFKVLLLKRVGWIYVSS